MSIDFSKFDAAVNNDTAKAIEEAKKNSVDGNLGDLPAGEYVVKIEKMELGATKDGRPMFTVQCRVIEAIESESEAEEYISHFKNKKPCMFLNRVIYGTKNDSNMIASVLGWLEKLESETKPEFKNYSQFADNILDIFEEVADAIELEVDYDPNKFNSISILEVFDAE